MIQKNKNSILGVGLVILTFFVFFLSITPVTKPYLIHFLIIAFALFAVSILYRKKRPSFFMYSLLLIILLAVSVTGWFSSPLFYLLYFGAVILSFLYAPIISVFFILTLTILFLPNIGTIDPLWDILNLIALFLVIPLTYFLRNEFLHVRESEKKILILEKEKKTYSSKVDEVLNNKVVAIVAPIREKVNDIKQLTFLAERSNSVEKEKKEIKKIQMLSQEVLHSLTEFEESTTGERLIKS